LKTSVLLPFEMDEPTHELSHSEHGPYEYCEGARGGRQGWAALS
jgi:hypothetical protein